VHTLGRFEGEWQSLDALVSSCCSKPLDEDEDAKKAYGPLFMPFSRKSYWFFAFNLTRRSALLGLSSLLFAQPVPRQFSLVILLACFLAVHSWVQPFLDFRDNLGGLVTLAVRRKSCHHTLHPCSRSCRVFLCCRLLRCNGHHQSLTLLAASAVITAAAPPEYTQDLSSPYGFVLFFQGLLALVLVLWMIVALVELGWSTAKEAMGEARMRLASRSPRNHNVRNPLQQRSTHSTTPRSVELASAGSRGSPERSRRGSRRERSRRSSGGGVVEWP